MDVHFNKSEMVLANRVIRDDGDRYTVILNTPDSVDDNHHPSYSVPKTLITLDELIDGNEHV